MMTSYIGESYVLESGNAQLVNISAYLNYFGDGIDLKYVRYLFLMLNPSAMMLQSYEIFILPAFVFQQFWCAHSLILISSLDFETENWRR
jgi:hypothetical protein